MRDNHLCADILKRYPYNAVTASSEIWRLQRAFNGRFIDYDKLHEDEKYRIDWVIEYLTCITDELSEVLGWLPWKHWKNYHKDGQFVIKYEELRFELIDILHFVMDLGFVLGVNPMEYDFCTDLTEVIPVLASRSELLDLGDQYTVTKVTKEWIAEMHMYMGRITDYRAVPGMAKAAYDSLIEGLVNGMAMFGLSAEDVYNYYVSKNQENINRQEGEYK